MAMSQERYDAMVAELEEFAEKNPSAYRWRVGALAWLGYGYVLLIVVLLLAFTALLTWAMLNKHINAGTGKLWFVMVALLVLTLRSLWVSIPPPEGLELTRETAPRLFAMLDEMQQKLACLPFHHVLLTTDFNAAVAQVPRFGILGGFRNYLIVGLPLLNVLSPEQFRAVLAHELGHLSGNHSKFSAWIYRVRRTWANLLERFTGEDGKTNFLFGPFARWYGPYFSAYSFVLARGDEYVADRCAAELTSAETISQALMQTGVMNRYLEEKFWEPIYKQVNQHATPTATPYSAMSNLVQSPTDTDREELERWLALDLLNKTDNMDTHPSLKDRMRALGTWNEAMETQEAKPPLPPLPTQTAAEVYLGERLSYFAERLDQEWREDVAPIWAHQHEYAQKSLQRLDELERKAQSEPLEAEEAWERARLTREFRSASDALPLLQEMLATRPEEIAVRFALGLTLLETKEESGIAHLEYAMERDSRTVLRGCAAIHHFLTERGRAAEADAYEKRYLAHYELEQEAEAETGEPHPKAEYLPPDLPAEQLEAVRALLATHPKIKAVYLVRKPIKALPDRKFYVLGFTPRIPWYRFSSDGEFEEIVQELVANLPLEEETRIVALNTARAQLRKRLQAIPGAKLV